MRVPGPCTVRRVTGIHLVPGIRGLFFAHLNHAANVAPVGVGLTLSGGVTLTCKVVGAHCQDPADFRFACSSTLWERAD